MEKKKKYIVKFVMKQQDIYTVIGKKKISPPSKEVRFRKDTYFVDINNPTYTKGLTLFFLIDIAGIQVQFTNKKKKTEKKDLNALITESVNYDPKVVDMIVSRKIVSQLTSNLSDNQLKMNILSLIIGVVMGLMGGFILAGYM